MKTKLFVFFITPISILTRIETNGTITLHFFRKTDSCTYKPIFLRTQLFLDAGTPQFLEMHIKLLSIVIVVVEAHAQ